MMIELDVLVPKARTTAPRSGPTVKTSIDPTNVAAVMYVGWKSTHERSPGEPVFAAWQNFRRLPQGAPLEPGEVPMLIVLLINANNNPDTAKVCLRYSPVNALLVPTGMKEVLIALNAALGAGQLARTEIKSQYLSPLIGGGDLVVDGKKVKFDKGSAGVCWINLASATDFNTQEGNVYLDIDNYHPLPVRKAYYRFYLGANQELRNRLSAKLDKQPRLSNLVLVSQPKAPGLEKEPWIIDYPSIPAVANGTYNPTIPAGIDYMGDFKFRGLIDTDSLDVKMACLRYIDKNGGLHGLRYDDPVPEGGTAFLEVLLKTPLTARLTDYSAVVTDTNSYMVLINPDRRDVARVMYKTNPALYHAVTLDTHYNDLHPSKGPVKNDAGDVWIDIKEIDIGTFYTVTNDPTAITLAFITDTRSSRVSYYHLWLPFDDRNYMRLVSTPDPNSHTSGAGSESLTMTNGVVFIEAIDPQPIFQVEDAYKLLPSKTYRCMINKLQIAEKVRDGDTMILTMKYWLYPPVQIKAVYDEAVFNLPNRK